VATNGNVGDADVAPEAAVPTSPKLGRVVDQSGSTLHTAPTALRETFPPPPTHLHASLWSVAPDGPDIHVIPAQFDTAPHGSNAARRVLYSQHRCRAQRR
jgi:hypothetical protein